MGKAEAHTDISRSDAIEIARSYAQKIRSILDNKAIIYLFGSTARNEANKNSDIDIAVVSELFNDDVAGDFTKVNLLAYEVDMRINAQAVAYTDWKQSNPFIINIKRNGIEV